MEDTLTELKYANHQVGTDVYPYEIIEVVSDRKILVREMHTEPDHENGYNYYEGGPWKCISTDRYPIKAITKRKNGRWYPQGQKDWYNAFYLSNKPRKYRDPHF